MILLYNEDFLEGMKRIPDGSVDMILTDPPFGTTDCDWDTPLPPPILFEQFWRVAKSNAAVVLYPEIPVYTAAIDERLNENCYIVPRLGDAGDRIFDTELKY